MCHNILERAIWTQCTDMRMVSTLDDSQRQAQKRTIKFIVSARKGENIAQISGCDPDRPPRSSRSDVGQLTCAYSLSQWANAAHQG